MRQFTLVCCSGASECDSFLCFAVVVPVNATVYLSFAIVVPLDATVYLSFAVVVPLDASLSCEFTFPHGAAQMDALAKVGNQFPR